MLNQTAKSSGECGLGSILGGGRYNPKGLFEAAYIAFHPDTAVREVRLVDQDTNGVEIVVPTKPFILITLQYELQVVVDLMDPNIQVQLGVSVDDDLLCDWEALLLHRKKVPTHVVGAAAREADVEGLIVPSKRFTGERNLVIFIDRLRPKSSIRIYDPDGFAPGTRTEINGSYVPKAKR